MTDKKESIVDSLPSPTPAPSEGDLWFNLSTWQGPLDLLLDLIKAAKIDIRDIPIREITSQYLEVIRLMRKLNIEVASEFILMASTLIYIKSQTILPSEIDETDEEEFMRDPRSDLVSQLLEYQKFKQAAEWLENREIHANRLIERQDRQLLFSPPEKDDDIWKEVTLFELIRVFSGIVDAVTVEEESYSLAEKEYRVEDKIDMIAGCLDSNKPLYFYSLFPPRASRAEIIATFWAILEMYKYTRLLIRQHSLFGDIYLLASDSGKNQSGSPSI